MIFGQGTRPETENLSHDRILALKAFVLGGTCGASGASEVGRLHTSAICGGKLLTRSFLASQDESF